MNEPLSHTKVIFALGLVVAVVVIVLIGLKGYINVDAPHTAPPPASVAESESVEAIAQELQGLDAGDLESELQGIEEDINQL